MLLYPVTDSFRKAARPHHADLGSAYGNGGVIINNTRACCANFAHQSIFHDAVFEVSA